MTAKRTLAIFSICFGLAFGLKAASIFLKESGQNNLTTELCQLMGLPLNTGSLREAFEGFEGALARAGQGKTCVSIIDNGRGYSADCVNPQIQFRATMCKAEANTGVKVAIYYEQQSIFSWSLLWLWLALTAGIIVLLLVFQWATKLVVSSFANQIGAQFQVSEKTEGGTIQVLAAWLLRKLGIAQILKHQAEDFRKKLKNFEQKVQMQARTQAQLEHDAKQAKAYTEKVRQIRHDIRSPLTALQSLLESVTADQRAAATLASAIRRMEILIDDLNEIDRDQESRGLLIAEVAIDEIGLLFKNKFRANKKAKFSVRFSAEQLSPLNVERKYFYSLIENLLENALEALQVGGAVLVSVRNYQGQCEITVDDDGCGISAEAIPQLFTRGGTFGKIGGVGLGLYHCKKIVMAWGGTIRHIPRQQGTRFEIKIPVVQTGVVFVGLEEKAAFSVIDDDQAVPEALKSAGYEILEVASSFDAGRTLLAKVAPAGAKILVDYRLGDKDLGTDLIAEQKNRSGIFLCTDDFDNLDLIKRAREIGVKILPKPFCFSKQFWSHDQDDLEP